MTNEPTERRKSQVTSAAWAAGVMVGRIPAEDVPLPVELAEHHAFTAGRPVVGVVLHAPHGTPAVLDRYQVLFGGVLSSVPVPTARDPYTEYRLLGSVPGPENRGPVPFLAVVRVVDGRVPLPRRERQRAVPAPVPGLLPGVVVPRGPADAEAALAHPAPAPAPAPVPVLGVGDGTAEALAVVAGVAAGGAVAPGVLDQAHDVLHPEACPAALARLAAGYGYGAAPAGAGAAR